ncbi:MAG: methyltransferase domain-containing protein [Silicimonas sp.]|nr:methyltransferase domain-containing protein [Silicimonas sp.]
MDLTLDIPSDVEALKARVRAQWDGAAEGWDRHEASIGRWLDDATAAMIDLAGIAPGASVLDIAAGSGAQSVQIAKRVGVSGRVVATDLSPSSVEIAKQRLGALTMAGASAMVADIEALPFEHETFDAVTCRLGLMFLPRPSVGLAEMRRVLRPGGRAVSVVFSCPERNPCITTLMRVATAQAGIEPPDPDRPGGLLSLGAPGLLARLYREARFSRVHELVVSAPFRMPSVRAYVDFVRDAAAPVVAILSRLPEDRREMAYGQIERELEEFRSEDGWEGPNELVIVWGDA